MREVWTYVSVFVDGKSVRIVPYGSDIDKARAAAERLAEERADA